MIKKLFLFIAVLLCSIALFAQNSDWGGVKGTVVNRAGRIPVAEASITLTQAGEAVTSATSDADGRFLIEGLPNGMYDMTIKAPGFLDANVNVTVEGYVKDLIFVGMVMEQVVTDVDDSNFAEFDMDDSETTNTVMLDSFDCDIISKKLAAINNKVRFSILEILRDNKKEPLYSRELNSFLLNKYNISITVQMLGQHLKQLVESDLIEEVPVKKEVANKIGRRNVNGYLLKNTAFLDLFLVEE